MEWFTQLAQISVIVFLLVIIVPLCLVWLFLYSAIKAGVKNGILAAHDRLDEVVVTEEEEFEEEMAGWK